MLRKRLRTMRKVSPLGCKNIEEGKQLTMGGWPSPKLNIEVRIIITKAMCTPHNKTGKHVKVLPRLDRKGERKSSPFPKFLEPIRGACLKAVHEAFRIVLVLCATPAIFEAQIHAWNRAPDQVGVNGI